MAPPNLTQRREFVSDKHKQLILLHSVPSLIESLCKDRFFNDVASSNVHKHSADFDLIKLTPQQVEDDARFGSKCQTWLINASFKYRSVSGVEGNVLIK